MSSFAFQRRLSFTNIFSILCFSLILSFINISTSEAKQSAASDKKFDRVILQLKWIHQFNFAGYYAAVEKGFYKEAGLDVTIKEGHPGMDFVDEVISERANYGVEMPELLIARHNGKPVVVLAAIFQHSPQIILTRADSGIKSPHNLIGKKVMWRFDSAAELRAMLINEKVSLEQIEFMELSWNINDLIDGKVDAIHAYVTDQPFSLEKAGIEVTELSPLRYGIDFYGDCLFTSEKELSKHPDRVKTFREASLRGWAYAMDHPEELMDIIREKYGTKSSREYMYNEFNHIKQLMLPKFIEIGHMNPGRWKHIGDTFVKLGMLDPDYSLDGFIYDPKPQPDNKKLIRIVWILLGVITAITISAIILFIYNRKLNEEVSVRTKHLSDEIAEREQVEKQLKASESFLHSVFENIPNMIFVKDAKDLRFVHFNKAGEKLLGYSRESLIGKNDYDFFPQEEAEFFTAKDKDVLANKKLLDIPEEPIQTKEKGKRTLHTKKIPILNENGEPVFLLGISEDITERKSASEERKILETKLHQAQKMESIGNLAGGIAHDFNNILSAIIGYTELALDDIERGSRLEKSLQQVFTAGKRARDLVKQILTFARQSDEELKPIRVDKIATEVLRLIRSTIPTTIEIRQEIESDLLIMGNPTQVHQLFVNLCTNAAHAMETKGGILRVSLKKVLIDGDYLWKNLNLKQGGYTRIEVSDTGAGIAPEIIDSIFEPYFTTKGPGEGTGMGLASVHGIVMSYGGKIMVNSTLGKGTTCSIYLPVTDDRIARQPYESEKLPSGNERILFVDDEAAIANMGSQILERLGYSVATRTRSIEALELFRFKKDDFDLIVTDMTMPNMTGDNLAVELMKIRPDIPIILFTGYSKKISDEKAKEIGIKAFAYKPIVKVDLAKTVRKVLDDAKKKT